MQNREQDPKKRPQEPTAPKKGAQKHRPKPHRKHKPDKKSKPSARAPGQEAAPKKATIGACDPWAPSERAPVTEKRETNEEHQVGEVEAEEEMNPVAKGLEYTDYVHLGGDALIEGETSGLGLQGLSEAMGSEAVEVLAGEGTGVSTTFAAGTGAVFGPAAIAGGIMEMAEAVNEYKHDKAGGITTGMGGAATAASGGAAMLGIFGVGGAATAAPALAAGAAGLKIGRYGNEQAKELGWIHDDNGRAEAPSSWVAENATNADGWITEHTHSPTLGAIGGGAAFVGSLPVAAGIATAGAINGGVNKLEDFGAESGKTLANFGRMEKYSGLNGEKSTLDAVDGIGSRNPYTGQVSIAERGTDQAQLAGQQMADYDDNLMDAVERSKLLHPERWGEQQNEVSMFNRVAAQMREGTHKK